MTYSERHTLREALNVLYYRASDFQEAVNEAIKALDTWEDAENDIADTGETLALKALIESSADAVKVGCVKQVNILLRMSDGMIKLPLIERPLTHHSQQGCLPVLF